MMIHFLYFVQQSRISSDGDIAAFILPFRPASFDLDADDSHILDVDAFGAAIVVLGDGNVCVDDPAIGRDVLRGDA